MNLQNPNGSQPVLPEMSPEMTAEQRWLNAGIEAHRAGRLQEAEQAYRNLLAEVPNSADGLHLSGLLIRDGGGNLNLAAEMIEAALDVRPDRAGYWYSLGKVRYAARRMVEAEHAFRRALALQADFPLALLELAEVLDATNRTEPALACVDRAVALGTDNPAVLTRAGSILAHAGADNGQARAELLYRAAMRVAPQESDQAHAFLAVLLLRQGKFAEGWAEAEYRLTGARPQVPMPMEMLRRWPRWQGDDLAGKRLLLCAEQGMGDKLQFVRYAQWLHAAGATVDVVGCTPALRGLLATAPGVAAAYDDASDRDDYDFWVPMLSVPGIAGTTLENVPAEVPYLKANPARVAAWREKLAGHTAAGRPCRVGLVWAGRPTHASDMFRTVDHPGRLKALAGVPGVSWFSLQVGEARAQLPQVAAQWPLFDVGAELADFGETAAAIENLDLVIAVDTSVAHLAGALGKPVWLMLGARHVDWRWLENRDDTPWYPSMRLFHQADNGWEGLAARLAVELAQLAGAKA